MASFLQQMTNGPRRILVTGHFGSGKTEFAVSLAFALAKLKNAGSRVSDQKEARSGGPAVLKESRLALVDLDIENPYFRSRERQEDLEAAGVRVYSDPFGGRNGSELQVITAAIFAPIQDEGCRVIIDCGGDQAGARILNQFSRHFKEDYQLLSVVNCNRPGTDTVEKAVRQIEEAQEATGLRVTGLISNAHMIRYTTAEDVINGWAFTQQVAEQTGIPALCACAMDPVADELETIKNAASRDASVMEIFRIGMYMRDSYLDKQV